MEESVVYTGWCRDLVEVMTEQMAAILLGRLSLVLCLSDLVIGETEKEKGGEGPWVLSGMRVTVLSTLWVLADTGWQLVGLLSVVHDTSVSSPKCPQVSLSLQTWMNIYVFLTVLPLS